MSINANKIRIVDKFRDVSHKSLQKNVDFGVVFHGYTFFGMTLNPQTKYATRNCYSKASKPKS